MTDQQRAAFRFRVPRLRPSVPPPRTTTTPARTAARKPPVRPLPEPSTTKPAPSPPPPPSTQPQGTTPAPSPAPTLPVVPSRPPPQEPPATTPALPVVPSPAPAPLPQEPPAKTPALPVVPSPAPAPIPQEPPAKTPALPVVPTATPAPPPQEPPAPTALPQESPAPTPLPQEPPASPPTAAKPLQPPVDPSPAQREPPVDPLLPRQDEPASTATTTIQAAPPSSPSQPLVSTQPPSPSKRLQPTSQPSSPQHVHTSQPPEVKMPAETASKNHQKGDVYALNDKTNEEQREITSMEQSSDHASSESHIEQNQHENQEAISTTHNIPNTPQTKTMISHSDDKIPVPESPESHKTNGPQPSSCEETTGINTPNQILNEKPAIITLAGDNRGTSMHIGSGATKREKPIRIYRRYKANPDESTDTMTDEEEKENDSKANENEENFSYINCNIQGINNSMVFNCSITERSPGVHLGSCNQDNVKKPKKKYIKSTNMNKVKVSTTPSKKHTVRRRCLRGLFMESTDSETNDPEKPRRHGCRVICEDKNNKNDKMDA